MFSHHLFQTAPKIAPSALSSVRYAGNFAPLPLNGARHFSDMTKSLNNDKFLRPVQLLSTDKKQFSTWWPNPSSMVEASQASSAAQPIDIIKEADCVLIKFGSSSIVSPQRGVNGEFLDGLVHQVDSLQQQDKKVMLVASGAVAAGRYLQKVGKNIGAAKRYSAGAGQMELASMFQQKFKAAGIPASLYLLNQVDNIPQTAETVLLGWDFDPKTVSILNGNDAVHVDNIVNNNDGLVAHMAIEMHKLDRNLKFAVVNCTRLRNPLGVLGHDDKPMQQAPINPEVLDELMQGGPGNAGTGGMDTKYLAIQQLAPYGIPTMICDTRNLGSKLTGTTFVPDLHAPLIYADKRLKQPEPTLMLPGFLGRLQKGLQGQGYDRGG